MQPPTSPAAAPSGDPAAASSGEPAAASSGDPAAAPFGGSTDDQLRLRPGEDGVTVAMTPARAGWRYLSFATRALAQAERMPFRLESSEAVIIVISGGGVTVEVNGRQPVELAGRRSVFDGLPWAVYLPPGSRGRVLGRPIRRDGRTVIAAAVSPVVRRSSGGREPVVITPDDIQVEIRGAGNASRQINHIVTPEFPADRLEVVEALTPGGNWSSWPPHKHDVDAMPEEAVLEEVYYYQFRRPEAWGVQRLYRGDRSRDALWEVRHGELVLVPDGYHPFTAAHGDDAYYLNALAGDHRTMACSDDPDLAWVRGTWDGQESDPRLPLVRGSSVASKPSIVRPAEPERAADDDTPVGDEPAIVAELATEPEPAAGDEPAVGDEPATEPAAAVEPAARTEPDAAPELPVDPEPHGDDSAVDAIAEPAVDNIAEFAAVANAEPATDTAAGPERIPGGSPAEPRREADLEPREASAAPTS